MHRHGVPTLGKGMQTRHYVAYVCYGSAQAPVWLEADDDRVRRLSIAPNAYPYLVFYELQHDGQTSSSEDVRLEQLPQRITDARIDELIVESQATGSG